MKKKFAFFALAIAATASLGGLTACGEDETNLSTAQGFNGYNEIQYVTTENLQGRLRACADDGFYTEGSTSLKLTVQKPTSYAWARYGEAKDFLPPTLKFPIEERDLNTVQTFLLDVYNANAYDTGVYLYAKSAEKVIWSAYATAQSGKWNKLAFPVNADFASGIVTEVCAAIADVNENTTYYFDNLQIVDGTATTPEVGHNGNVVVAFENADERKAAGFFCKTDVPAANLAFAFDPENKSRGVMALRTEAYSGRINSVSHTKDDREYGFTVARSAVESFDFTNARKCYIEVYNACGEPKKLTLSVGDGEKVASRETEIPVGKWTKLSVNNLLSLDLTKISEISVTLNSYANFEAGAIYFKNLSVEVGK